MNYFEVFGLPRALNLDLATLEKKFHELSRQFHPDYYTTASKEEKGRALRMTALLNDAYRTLRHPTRRVEYLLSLSGLKSDGSRVPQSLLMEVFEVNEQLEEAKAAGDPAPLAAIRLQIEARRKEFDSQLQAATFEWDSLIARNASEAEQKTQLIRLAEILSESSYIRNLEEEI